VSTQDGPASGGLRAGHIAGIPLRVSPSWFLVAALLTVIFAPVVEDYVPELGAWSYAVAAAFAVLLYASVLVHELGHALVARAYGLPVRRITLHLLGGFTEIEQESRKPSQELLIAAAGPTLSLAIGLGALPLLVPLEPRTVSYVLVLQLAYANLLVGVFNLLPGLPLDGGRVLRALVWGATGKPLTGTRVAAHVGRAMAAVVLALPFLLAWLSGGSPTVFGVVWAGLLAVFIWGGATQALRSAEVRERLPSLQARALTRRALPVQGQVPVAEALRRARAAAATALVVTDTEDRPLGLVNEAAVNAVPEDRRPWVGIGTLARRIEPSLVVPIHLSGDQLVATLRAHPASEYLVVDERGDVYGVLATADVERALVGAPR
jgi:Zn-dependent protease